MSSRHPISEAPPLYVRFSEDGRFIRKWSFEPFAGATRYLPSYEMTTEAELVITGFYEDGSPY